MILRNLGLTVHEKPEKIGAGAEKLQDLSTFVEPIGKQIRL